LSKFGQTLRHIDSSRARSKNDLGLLFCNLAMWAMRPYFDNKLREKMIHPLLVSLTVYSPQVFHAIRHTAGSTCNCGSTRAIASL